MKVEQGIVGWDYKNESFEFREFEIKFKTAFKEPPVVHASIQTLDTWSTKDSTTRVWVGAEKISRTGATIKIGTWNGNKLGGCKVAWLALGM